MTQPCYSTHFGSGKNVVVKDLHVEVLFACGGGVERSAERETA